MTDFKSIKNNILKQVERTVFLTMRKIFSYLLGEDVVNKQGNKEITEWGIGIMYCILFAVICWAMISVLV